MDDRTPEEIAMGLSKRMRSLLTELPDDGPMVDFRPCVFDFPMPTLMALVKRERAPTMRGTWNALRDLGHVTIDGRRVTLRTGGGK